MVGMSAQTSRHWRDLPSRSRAAIVAGAAVQFALLAAALADLRRRRPEELNGPRKLWVAVCFVNFVGPLAYFVLGRRRHPGASTVSELALQRAPGG